MKEFDVAVTKKVVDTHRVQARNHGEAMVKVGGLISSNTEPASSVTVDTRVARPVEVKDEPATLDLAPDAPAS
jgi:hypothetical protein